MCVVYLQSVSGADQGNANNPKRRDMDSWVHSVSLTSFKRTLVIDQGFVFKSSTVLTNQPPYTHTKYGMINHMIQTRNK